VLKVLIFFFFLFLTSFFARVFEEICATKGKGELDKLATAFVSLASLCEPTFHASWLQLTLPCLSGLRLPSPLSVAMMQSYLVQHSTEWVHMILAPFFSRLVAGKMKRKRAMKDSDLIESFQIVMELLTSDDALNILPRNVRALAGLLWNSSRNMGLSPSDQADVVADFFFQRLIYPVLLVPDQYGLIELGRPLRPLAKQILQGVTKCLSAVIYKMDLSSTAYACMVPFVPEAAARIETFVKKLAVDPEHNGFADFVNHPDDIDIGMEHGDGGLGLWLTLLLQSGRKSEDEKFKEIMNGLEIVGSELERRRAIASVINEEQEFTIRVDGVTFWLRELDYGVMMEGTAMRMANEWLKKVNQLRAVLRMGLNKRTHPSQWNGIISDLLEEADWSVFAEFGKILRSNLPIVANSVDESLEQAIVAYKRENSRDPLRDLIAVLVHGKTLLTRIYRLPLALDEGERDRLIKVLDQASEYMDISVSSDCSEMVRLHQMQSSMIAGWSNFPNTLLEGSGIVKAGRRQVMYGKIVATSPASIKTAKYAMLLSDSLVLMEMVKREGKMENASSAIDREANFGGGNAFQQKVSSTPDLKKRGAKKDAAEEKAEKKNEKKNKAAEICFRLIVAIDLADAQLRLRPSTSSFLLIDRTGVSYDIAVSSSQKMEWITSWSKINCMQHSQSLTPRASDSGKVSPGGTPRPRSGGASPAGSNPTSPRPETPRSDDEDDIDEMEALMALGMYDTAVIKKPDAPESEADNQFMSMVGNMKRRDGKSRIALTELFTPPPGLVVRAWKDSIRMMKHHEPEVEEEAAGAGAGAGAVVEEPLSPKGKVIEETVSETNDEELALREMMANLKCTLRFFKE
jgi:hypothetical protein